MRSLHAVFTRSLDQRMDVHAERLAEEAHHSLPSTLQDEGLSELIDFPLKETGDLSGWLTNHPSIEYSLWLGHITRKAKTPEETEAILQKKVPQRLRMAERAPFMFRARMGALATFGAGIAPVAAYGAYETVSHGNWGGTFVCALAGSGCAGMIRDAIAGWKSSHYDQLVEDVYREKMYHDSAMDNLDQKNS